MQILKRWNFVVVVGGAKKSEKNVLKSFCSHPPPGLPDGFFRPKIPN
jgi:hypothetical protein